MGKALPMKYFPGCGTARIYYRKVTKWAEQWAKHGDPYFDTWGEAHKFMLDKSTKEIDKLDRELKAEIRHLARVTAMRDPSRVGREHGIGGEG